MRTIVGGVLALVLCAHNANAQCNFLGQLRADAEQKAAAVRAATERKAERNEVCDLVTRFVTAEAAVLTFLEANKTWCGIPAEAIEAAHTNYERTVKLHTMGCAEEPATGTPSATNIKSNPSSRMKVPLKKQGGTFVAPVQINGAITLDFFVDSGAADVSVPLDVFSTLRRAGTIRDSDILGEQTYTLADGSKSQSVTFTIRSLKVGDKIVENVRGRVAPSRGTLLLGQSFLERFKSWSIDNTKHELLLEPR